MFFRFVVKAFLPMILAFFIKKGFQNLNKQYGASQQQDKPEGTITVDHIPEDTNKSKKNPDSDLGDYVDYEEVK